MGPALPSCVMVTVTPNPLYMPMLLAQLDYTGLSADRMSLLQECPATTHARCRCGWEG
jgi:hypothetical protein